MTTLVSLATRDCIVIGCDSLATSSQTILDPHRVFAAFFNEDGQIKLDDQGRPLLDSSRKLIAFTESLPRNQLPNVTKVFSINGLKAGLLFAGIAGIGTKSVRNLVEQFAEECCEGFRDTYTIEAVAQALADFLDAEFEAAFAETPKEFRPTMEILLSGYSPGSRRPEIFRVTLGTEKTVQCELQDGKFDVIFGGQHDVIQRVVTGIDFQSFCNLNSRFADIVARVREEVILDCQKHHADYAPPSFDADSQENQLFGGNFGGVRGIFSDIGGLSEQAAINFVDFLITTMINAQEFSDRIPTVGGEVHIALINRTEGFRWISKEEFKFRDHSVPKYE